MAQGERNILYYGDNLDVLRRHVKDETIDLVYLDPPFNSKQSYNVLFAEKDGTQSAAQIEAFGDTWHWDIAAARLYQEVVERGDKTSDAMLAFRQLLGTNDMLAYLANMAPRLLELHRVLRPTGSIYLHCDPTASHYLKILMDAIFGPRRFLNEIIWKRSSAHSDTKQGMKRCGKIHDVLLLYSKTSEYTWNPQYTPYAAEYQASEYRHLTADGRRYKQTDATAAKPGGDTEYDWHVKRPRVPKAKWEADLDSEFEHPDPAWEYKAVRPYNGRFWAYSIENMREFARQGKLHHRSTGFPRIIQFASEMQGISLQDMWTDINPELGKDDLGYPTQKPIALLERIVLSSSNDGDTVLDPFCGCGTTIAAAHKLKRRWIGIDITYLAISLIKTRLTNAYGEVPLSVIGEPKDLAGARALAEADKYQFQWWALDLIGARRDPKKGADQGIDGKLYFHDEGPTGRTKKIIISVKGGKVGVDQVRDLRGVLDREKADIGVMVSMEHPTRPMREEAAGAGFYESSWGKHPRIQLLTIEEILAGKRIDFPAVEGTNVTVKKAPKAEDEKPDNRDLFAKVEGGKKRRRR